MVDFSSASGIAALGAAIAAYVFVILGILVIVLISKWKVFEKAGQPGWAAIVPIYNICVLFRVGGQSAWWALSLLAVVVPIVGPLFLLFVIIRLVHRVSKRFGHGVGFTLGLVFLSFIFWPILGFGSSRYTATPSATPPATPPPVPA